MRRQSNTTSPQLVYNECVQAAYNSILKFATRQLAAIEREELRYSLIRKHDSILHEMVNPLLYLRLEVHSYGLYSISYGIEIFDGATEYSKVTASFIREVYKLTAKERTDINIENCVHVDRIVTHCSELYEYIDERNEHHTFWLIKHKVAASQRKKLLSVA